MRRRLSIKKWNCCLVNYSEETVWCSLTNLWTSRIMKRLTTTITTNCLWLTKTFQLKWIHVCNHDHISPRLLIVLILNNLSEKILSCICVKYSWSLLNVIAWFRIRFNVTFEINMTSCFVSGGWSCIHGGPDQCLHLRGGANKVGDCGVNIWLILFWSQMLWQISFLLCCRIKNSFSSLIYFCFMWF